MKTIYPVPSQARTIAGYQIDLSIRYPELTASEDLLREIAEALFYWQRPVTITDNNEIIINIH